MNIELIEVPVPAVVVVAPLRKVDIRETLLKEKCVTMYGEKITKTRINTSIVIGEGNMYANMEKDGFKTAEKEEYNSFSGSSRTHHYFTLSKKQGVGEYKEYVKTIVRDLLAEKKVDVDEFKIYFYLRE